MGLGLLRQTMANAPQDSAAGGQFIAGFIFACSGQLCAEKLLVQTVLSLDY